MNLQQYLLFNHIEALVWLSIGAAFLIYSVATRFKNRLAVIAAVAFFVFGCTDFLECESRASALPGKHGSLMSFPLMAIRLLRLEPTDLISRP